MTFGSWFGSVVAADWTDFFDLRGLMSILLHVKGSLGTRIYSPVKGNIVLLITRQYMNVRMHNIAWLGCSKLIGDVGKRLVRLMMAQHRIRQPRPFGAAMRRAGKARTGLCVSNQSLPGIFSREVLHLGELTSIPHVSLDVLIPYMFCGALLSASLQCADNVGCKHIVARSHEIVTYTEQSVERKPAAIFHQIPD